MTITMQDFRAAKKAVKKQGVADLSAADRVAREVLVARCPKANAFLIRDMAWQVVMSVKCG